MQGETQMKTNRLFLIVIVLAAGLLAGCGPIVRGSGVVTTEERSVSGFEQVALLGMGDVIVTQGETESLRIEAEDNLLPYLTAEVKNSTLELGFKPNLALSVWPTQQIKFHVTLKKVSGLQVRGSGNISAERLTAEQLLLAIGGSGNITMGALNVKTLNDTLSGSGNIQVAQLTAENVETNLSGSGKCILTGQTGKQLVLITGSGNYQAFDLQSQTAAINISGSGNVETWVVEKMDVRVLGSGQVSYYGAAQVSENISGVGNVSSLGAHVSPAE
jgi:hypothetical protein